MPQTYSYLLHSAGPALWPEHKPLAEVEDLRNTTPEQVWEATYQGNPVPPGGAVFRREWWDNANRYDVADGFRTANIIARYISWDTGIKDKDTSAFTVAVVGELYADYRLQIRDVFRNRLTFPHLPPHISQLAQKYEYDGKTRAVLIEDKASGTSAYQTLMAGADRNLAQVLWPFQPQGDKEQRAMQAAVWCKNGMVMLPHPDTEVPWLLDYEAELFSFPLSAFMDQVDATSQLILYVENILAEGWRKREGHK